VFSYANNWLHTSRTWSNRLSAGEFCSINLTVFMGSASSFSPVILIVAGGLLSQVGEK
tara:strand:+ start:170 stop:343 length:174 start_codon:yes stop_codon:yes gene_type:complete